MFLVAIDVGHTKDQFGAVSARGKKEYYYNREIADMLHRKIQVNKQLDAFIVNPNGSKITLKERTKIASNKKANLFLSLHHDSVQPQFLLEWEYDQKTNLYSDRYKGYSIFISNKNIKSQKSYRAAKFLGKELKKKGFVPTLHHAERISGENRKLLDKEIGIYEYNDLVVLKSAPMPAILLECGVIVNRKDELFVSSHDYRTNVIDAIIRAILKYKKELDDT